MKVWIAALLGSAALCVSAEAADFGMVNASKGPRPFHWTGAYVGVFGGVTAGDYTYDATSGGVTGQLKVSGDGFIGGVQAGADYQFSNLVVGAVADIAYTDHEARISGSIAGLGTASASAKLQYLGTVRARVGVANGPFLFYGHGGLAYGSTKQRLSATGLGSLDNDSGTKFGFTVGAGVEYAITDHMSFQTEYAYTHFEDDTLYDDGVNSIKEKLSFSAIKAGLNYRF